MAVEAGYSKIATSGSVFIYDTGDTINSYQGEPTTNYVPSPYNYSLYAYASGPVDVSTVDQNGNAITAKRYTITNAVNVARAAIFPSSLTTGVSYTFSFKWRYNGSTTSTPSVGISAAKGNPEGGANNNGFTSQTQTDTYIGNGWYYSVYTFVFSSCPTSACILTFGINTGSTASYVNETFDIYQAQFEIKSHATPWANGTRSNTQGLLDISGGGNSLNLVDMSYDANAMMTFDGTNDKISNTTSITFGTRFSMEAVVYRNNATTGDIISSWNNPYIFLWRVNSSGYQVFAWNGGGAAQTITATSVIGTGAYKHIAITGDGTNIVTYNNGVATDTFAKAPNMSNFTAMQIGANTYDSIYFNGYIPVVKVYNRALSAAEVLSNFNHYKTRFNIT